MSQLATWPITTCFHSLVSLLDFNFYPTPVCHFCPTPVHQSATFAVWRFDCISQFVISDFFCAILKCTPALAFHVIKAFHVIRTTHVLRDKFQTCGGERGMEGQREDVKAAHLMLREHYTALPEQLRDFQVWLFVDHLFSRFSHVNVKGNASIIKVM